MPAEPSIRVHWVEGYLAGSQHSVRIIIAERVSGRWKFCERDPSEIGWYPLESTNELVGKADELVRKELAKKKRAKGNSK